MLNKLFFFLVSLGRVDADKQVIVTNTNTKLLEEIASLRRQLLLQNLFLMLFIILVVCTIPLISSDLTDQLAPEKVAEKVADAIEINSDFRFILVVSSATVIVLFTIFNIFIKR